MVQSVSASPQPTPDVIAAAAVYAATFAGRLDAYAVHTGDHWQAVRQPLTPQVVLNAFATLVPISAYPMSPESTSHVACLDIDREDGYELGKRFGVYLSKKGGVGYLEGSARGCHFWVPLSAPLPALTIRRALKALVKEAGLPDDPKIELRPGSDKLNGSDSLGHCIRMPTMPHQRTHQRHRLISTEGLVLPGRLVEMMLEIDPCDADVFLSAAERAPLPAIRKAPKDLRYPHGDPPLNDSACDILRDLWGVENPRPGRACRCPAHDDRRPSLSVSRDDQRVWCKTDACILSNGGQGRGTYELVQLAPSSR